MNVSEYTSNPTRTNNNNNNRAPFSSNKDSDSTIIDSSNNSQQASRNSSNSNNSIRQRRGGVILSSSSSCATLDSLSRIVVGRSEAVTSPPSSLSTPLTYNMENKMESSSNNNNNTSTTPPSPNNNNEASSSNNNIHENSTFESFSEEESTVGGPPLVVIKESIETQVELCETLAITSTTSTLKNTPEQQHQQNKNNNNSTTISIFRRSLTGELLDEKEAQRQHQQQQAAVDSCMEKGESQQRRNSSNNVNNSNNNSSSNHNGEHRSHHHHHHNDSCFMCCYTRSNSDDDEIDSQRRVAYAATAATTKEENVWMHIYQISMYSIVGMTIRVFLERLFGLDCTSGDAAIQDVFTPFFKQICVTTNGFTSQTGGALFIDLPANMLGCFIIGLVSNSSRPQHPIPWFESNHALQKNTSYLLGLRVGLCGCLTTFASWNTQMVVMLDGTGTVLGPQIAAAVFGYLLGLCSAVASFLFGQHAAEWLYNMHEQNRQRRSNRQHLRRREQLQQELQQRHVVSPPTTCTHDEEDQLARLQTVGEDHNTVGNRNNNNSNSWLSSCCDMHRRFKDFMFGADGLLAPVLVSGLVAAFVVGDVVYQIPFYRQMWLTSAMSPFGALLRWQLKKFFNHQPWPCGCRNRTRRIIGLHHSGSGNSDNAAVAAAAASTMTSAPRLGSSMRRVSESVMNIPVAFVDWMPWGTFVANMLAVIVSASAKALLQFHYYNGSDHPWAHNILWALTTGFAGNLSTVSTFISEIVAMNKPSQMHIYAFGSLGLAMVIGLAVYSPIARIP